MVAGGLGNNPPPPNSAVPPDAAVDVVAVEVEAPPGVLEVAVSAGLAGNPNKPWVPEGVAPVPLGGCAKTEKKDEPKPETTKATHSLRLQQALHLNRLVWAGRRQMNRQTKDSLQ